MVSENHLQPDSLRLPAKAPAVAPGFPQRPGNRPSSIASSFSARLGCWRVRKRPEADRARSHGPVPPKAATSQRCPVLSVRKLRRTEGSVLPGWRQFAVECLWLGKPEIWKRKCPQNSEFQADRKQVRPAIRLAK